MGKANRRTDTKPEVGLRSALHQAGLRFRKDLLIRCGDVRVKPDVAFTRRRVAVRFCGCFWHSGPQHGRVPAANREYWVPKLQRNVDRDLRTTEALQDAGWTVMRVWEHEPLAVAVEMVVRAVHQ